MGREELFAAIVFALLVVTLGVTTSILNHVHDVKQLLLGMADRLAELDKDLRG